ncbi:NAD+ synthase [Candidatus Peregrinibacteria bacterium]|nr:NAD+ synthase [Candidatus Peregrinibacteria bacterium]
MDQLSMFNLGNKKKNTTPTEPVQETEQETPKASQSAQKKLSDTPRIQNAPIMEKIYRTIIAELRAYFQKNNFVTGIIGLSGGIDSSLTLKLAVDAIGSENIIGAILPEIGLTARENIDHAKKLAEFLGVKMYYHPINTLVIDFKLVPWKPSELAQMNSRARIRSVLLYSLANTFNGLVLGTSNKSEILLGYGTKYGDLAADIEVIGSLYKTEVYELARHLKFSDVLLEKPPSAELKIGQTDEEDLGASYKDLDGILMQFEKGRTIEELIERGMTPSLIHKVARRMAVNKHKREMPPVIKTAHSEAL